MRSFGKERTLIEFVYNFQSPETALVFQILIIAEVFVFLTAILSQFMAACDKQKQFAIIGGIGAIINVVLNILLIPKFSLYGAGIATTITYALMFILMYIYTRKNILKFNFFKRLWLPLLATIGLWFLISLVLINLNLVWIILISALAYGLVVGLGELL